MSRILRVAGLAALAVAAPIHAGAVTIAVEASSAVTRATPNPIADRTRGRVFQNVTTSRRGLRLSPFAGTALDGAPFSSVSGRSSATYRFDAPQSALSLLWGSPDRGPARRNVIEFFLGANPLAIAKVTAASARLRGASFVTISDILFDRVVISDRASNAFEYANMRTVAAVPTPTPILLMLSGLLGVYLLGRRRSAATAIIPRRRKPIRRGAIAAPSPPAW